MDGQTIITVVTIITTTITTIVTLFIKDRADERRWEKQLARVDLRHAENTAKLDVIQTEVNGKMDHVISIAHAAGIAEGAAVRPQEGTA